MRKQIYFLAAAFFLSILTVSAVIVVNDNFTGGQGSWATRNVSGTTVDFGGGTLDITISPVNAEPGAAYHAFSGTALNDGDTLRLSVDVSGTNTAGSPDDMLVISLSTTN